jgi:hypothetical protein
MTALDASLSTRYDRLMVKFTEKGFSLPKALMEDLGETGEIVWGPPEDETVIALIKGDAD